LSSGRLLYFHRVLAVDVLLVYVDVVPSRHCVVLLYCLFLIDDASSHLYLLVFFFKSRGLHIDLHA